jgi:hypothetical protein
MLRRIREISWSFIKGKFHVHSRDKNARQQLQDKGLVVINGSMICINRDGTEVTAAAWRRDGLTNPSVSN